jgi:hypothetical protein
MPYLKLKKDKQIGKAKETTKMSMIWSLVFGLNGGLLP